MTRSGWFALTASFAAACACGTPDQASVEVVTGPEPSEYGDFPSELVFSAEDPDGVTFGESASAIVRRDARYRYWIGLEPARSPGPHRVVAVDLESGEMVAGVATSAAQVIGACTFGTGTSQSAVLLLTHPFGSGRSYDLVVFDGPASALRTVASLSGIGIGPVGLVPQFCVTAPDQLAALVWIPLYTERPGDLGVARVDEAYLASRRDLGPCRTAECLPMLRDSAGSGSLTVGFFHPVVLPHDSSYAVYGVDGEGHGGLTAVGVARATCPAEADCVVERRGLSFPVAVPLGTWRGGSVGRNPIFLTESPEVSGSFVVVSEEASPMLSGRLPGVTRFGVMRPGLVLASGDPAGDEGIWVSRLSFGEDGRLVDERHPLPADDLRVVGLPSADGGRGAVISVSGALRFYPLTEYETD